jgi:hypothetical protein
MMKFPTDWKFIKFMFQTTNQVIHGMIMDVVTSHLNGVVSQ